MFEQMRHAGLAVTLVPRADEHRQVDGYFGLGVVGKEQRAQAVVELIFSNSLDRGHHARRGWFGGSCDNGNKQHGREREVNHLTDKAHGGTCVGRLGFHSEQPDG